MDDPPLPLRHPARLGCLFSKALVSLRKRVGSVLSSLSLLPPGLTRCRTIWRLRRGEGTLPLRSLRARALSLQACAQSW